MLTACLAEDAIEYVVWKGLSFIYPRWFTDGIMDLVEQNNNTYWKGDRILPLDVFIKNGNNEIMLIRRDEFNTTFITVNNYECCFRDKVLLWRDLYPDHKVLVQNYNGDKQVFPKDRFTDVVRTYYSIYS